MEKDFNNIINSISDRQPPKGLKQAVFDCIEKEKKKSVARNILWLRIGFVISGISSFAMVAIFGREILSSEFASLVLLGFSDLKTVMALWQDYSMSLLETLPTASIVAVLLPIFVLMILAKQYAKIENNGIGIVYLSSRTPACIAMRSIAGR